MPKEIKPDYALLREDKSEKPDFTYVSELYDEFARVMFRFTYGEKKYSRLNFLNACTKEDLLSYEQSTVRHCLKENASLDDEDHAAAEIVDRLISMRIKRTLKEQDEKDSRQSD